MVSTVVLLETVSYKVMVGKLQAEVIRHRNRCGGLSLAGCQMLTKMLSQSPSSTGQGEKIRWRRSWLDIKTWTSLIHYHHRQKKLNIGKINIIYCQFKTEQDKKETKTKLKSPSPHAPSSQS